MPSSTSSREGSRLRLPVLLLAVALAAPALALAPVSRAGSAYPDPGKAPRYFPSDCFAQFDRRFVIDHTATITDLWGEQIEGAACEAYAKTGAHFVLAAVPSTNGESLEGYALHLFETWGIGDGDRNDGVLLLYVKDHPLDGRASAVRIEVGYGLEGTINAILAHDIIVEMGNAKENALAGGESEDEAVSYALAMGALLILQTLMDSYHDGHFPAPQSGVGAFLRSVPLEVWIFALVLVVSLVVALRRSSGRGGSGWGYYPGSPHWSSGVGRTFSGGSSGGGGFGGGRSGGGGGSGGF